MSRHRKIDVRIWGDARFQALSRPAACAQFLWLYLLTGPHTTALPGLFVAGEASLAEALHWTLKDFRKAFGEVLNQGMAFADFSARLVWVPNAIRYNAPENPNVVLSWRHAWDEIPECPLKAHAYLAYQKYFAENENLSKAFAQAFGKACNFGQARVLVTPLANQEQEQEQEQEQDNTPPTPPAGGATAEPLPENLRTPEFLVEWGQWLEHRRALKRRLTPQAIGKQLAKLSAWGSARAIAAIRHSIANGWQGIFEESRQGANGTESMAERIARRAAERKP